MDSVGLALRCRCWGPLVFPLLQRPSPRSWRWSRRQWRPPPSARRWRWILLSQSGSPGWAEIESCLQWCPSGRRCPSIYHSSEPSTAGSRPASGGRCETQKVPRGQLVLWRSEHQLDNVTVGLQS